MPVDPRIAFSHRAEILAHPANRDVRNSVYTSAMFNLKFALRTLFKAPLVTTVAILSLALGIGANVAIFSLFNQVILRPLPVARPGELVNLGAPGPKPGSTNCNQSGDCETVFSHPMFQDLERQQTAFSSLAAFRIFPANISL